MHFEIYYLLLSDVCQLCSLIYFYQGNKIIKLDSKVSLFSLMLIFYTTGITLYFVALFQQMKTFKQMILCFSFLSKVISFWIAYQCSKQFLNISLIATQLIFHTQNTSTMQYQYLVLNFQYLLQIFSIENVIENYIEMIFTLIQLSLIFVSSIILKFNLNNQQDNIKEQYIKKQNHLQTNDLQIQIDLLQQAKNTNSEIQTQRKFQLPENCLLLDKNLEIVETSFDFLEITLNQTDYHQAVSILLEQPCSYIKQYQSRKSLLRSAIIDIIKNDNFQPIFLFKNEYLKNKLTLLVKKIIIEEESFFQLFFVFLPEENEVTQETSMILDMGRSLSHELGTNLNSIITFVRMALTDQLITEEIKQKYLNPIKINSEQLNLIVGSLRDYNLITLQQFSLKVEELDLEFEIRYLITLLNDAIENKGITIDYNLQLDNNILVNDKIRFREVLFQLLQNAVKFTFQSNIKITIQNDNQQCFVSISDHGIGMSDEEAENLNSLLQSGKFVRVSEQSIGVGLGLGISNHLVKQMNENKQSIQLNRNSKGCEFSFSIKNYILEFSKQTLRKMSSNIFKKSSQTIKFLSANTYIEEQIVGLNQKITESYHQKYWHSQQILMPSKLRATSSPLDIVRCQSDDDIIIELLKPPIMSPKFQESIVQCSLKSDCCSRVLIVDDEYFNIQCLKLIMNKYQSKCDSAFNGQEALQLVHEKYQKPCTNCGNKYYSLIFLDVNMPILDGYKTVEQLKKLMKESIINKAWCVANTGFCDLETKMKSYESGMDFFLTKPLDQIQLKEILSIMFPIQEF